MGGGPCGSVITTIYSSRSRYCAVGKFIQVQNNNSMGLIFTVIHCFADVGTTQVFCDRWYDGFLFLSMCIRPIHLWYVVRVCEITQDGLRRSMCNPHWSAWTHAGDCNVMPDLDGVHYFMLRSNGLDRSCERIGLIKTGAINCIYLDQAVRLYLDRSDCILTSPIVFTPVRLYLDRSDLVLDHVYDWMCPCPRHTPVTNHVIYILVGGLVHP